MSTSSEQIEVAAATPDTLAILRQQRSNAKGNITRIKNSIGTERSVIELQCRLDILNSYIRQIMTYQTEIEKINPQDDRRPEIEELCISAKSKVMSCLGSHVPNENSIHDNTLSVRPSNRLPNLKLPTFDGRYSDYKNFIASFNNLVHDEISLSPIEKFNHLLTCLSGDALRTIKAFQITEDNYPKALQRLAERYDKKCLIFFDNIEQIFEIPTLNKPNASLLRKTVDTVSAVYDSLLSLGSEKDITNALLIYLVLSKVDSATKSKWNDQLDYATLPTWENCAKVLIRRCQTLEVNEDNFTKNDNTRQNYNKKIGNSEKSKPRSSFTCSQETKMSKCIYCRLSDHYIYNCKSFASLDVTQRYNFVKSNALCLNCLKKGHSLAHCNSSRCRTCKGPHHTLLHKQQNQQPNSVTEIPSTTINNPPNTSLSMHTKHANSFDNVVLLATAVVQIRDKWGNFHNARAMLDSGSQINIMTDECANRLKVKRCESNMHIAGVGELSTDVNQQTSTVIKSRVNNYEFVADFYIMKSISTFQPSVNIATQNWSLPDNIVLADPQFHKRQKVDILLGADVFFNLLCVGQIKLGEFMPLLQKTLLGWVVSGRFTPSNYNAQRTCHLVQDEHTLRSIDYTLKQFWQIDDLANCKQKLSNEHQACEDNFKDNVVLLPEGRFQVRLPFKTDPSHLGLSFDIAQRRFLALERRLTKSPDIQQMYNEFMKDYLNLKHMTPTNNTIPTGSHYFIPHQVVLRPDSKTTKLRVVFDASAKTSSQLSLNDTLLVGPTIQPDLFATLLQFRLKKYAITADITKMYRQVLVHKDDRKYQLILWRENANMPIQIFELNTVTYGTSPAPFLAIRCLHEIAEKFDNVYPEGAKAIKEQFYVDDLLSGGEDLEQLENIRMQATLILQSAGFKLAKWFSNHNFYSQHASDEKLLDFNNDEITKTLGLKWIPSNDIFKFQLPKDFANLKSTKRNILSTIARLFDPLGLVCPVITKSKILMQELWINKLTWDESIPQYLETQWRCFKADLEKISTVSLSRYVRTSLENRIIVHGFSDASIRAYGCCFYVVSVEKQKTFSSLLVAKSKVAPTKTITLPRLELCAAHLLAKVWNQIEALFSPYAAELIFWTDSEIVLHWLNRHASELNTFVGNRVSQIQEWSSKAEWRHVPTNMNPADIVSRGCTVAELLSSFWFEGPEFIQKGEEFWPINPHFKSLLKKDLPEVKHLKTVCNSSELQSHCLLELMNRCSSYMKVLRAIAYVYRFIMPNNNNKPEQLTSEELEWSFLKIVATIQQHKLAPEIHCLRKSTLLSSKYQQLTPFLQDVEQNGRKICLMRVGGRLLNADLSYDVKFPLLLPAHTRFVDLYMKHIHLSNYHCGPKIIIGLLRQRIWVINAREQARKIVRNCVHCFKYRPKLTAQIMGNLPADRLKAIRPFFIAGVDFCGPVYTTYRIRGKQPYKTYVAVFVCFSSKAVHIEAVSDLTTNAFISCLKRFIGRRGVPKKLYCDNATNFVGANSELRELKERFFEDQSRAKLLNFVGEHGIEFAFIPPRAPHFGGLWEAAVKSTKNLMIRTVRNANLTFEELSTVLVEIEAILNSRPLIPLSEDPNDGEALTPAHLLIGSALKTIPEKISENSVVPSSKRYQLISNLKAQFWRIFERDYVLGLQQRSKWSTPATNLQTGDLVLVHEDNLPPLKWMLGRITKVNTGADGKVRIAEVQTKSGLLKRAIHKLALLPKEI